MTYENESKRLLTIRSRIEKLRAQLPPSEDKRLVRDLFDSDMQQKLFPPKISMADKLAFLQKKSKK